MICSGGGILFAADLQALNIERIMPDEIVRPLMRRAPVAPWEIVARTGAGAIY